MTNDPHITRSLPAGLLEELLTALPDPVFILSETGRYLAIIGGSDSNYYHDGSSLAGMSLHDVLSKEKADWFLRQIHQVLDEQKLRIVEYGLSGTDVDGLDNSAGPMDEIWFEGRIQPLQTTVADERAVVWVASNITRRHQLENKLRRISETDPLTKIANRRKFFSELHMAYSRFKRYGHTTSLLMLDIDYFKTINDSFGHLAGDRILFRMARLCEEQLREIDLLCRFGGEEFTILLPDTEAADAVQIAERLRHSVARHIFRSPEEDIRITISIGLSQILDDDNGLQDIVTRADKALYQAKESGRNRVVSM